MGVVFQLPVISFILGKMEIINAGLLSKYRKHAFLIILTLAAIITPGLVAFPLSLLYEVSIQIVKRSLTVA